MSESRSLTYSINVEANTSQAESNVRNLTSSLGSLQNGGARINIEADTSQAESNIRNVIGNLEGLQSEANSIGSAFRSSFLEGIDSGQSFSSSIKSGIGGALSHVGSKVSEFKENFVSGAQSIKNGFEHPIQTIKNGLGGALQGAKDKFVEMARGANQAADGADDVGDSARDAARDVQNFGDSASDSGGKFEVLGGVLKGVVTAIGAATVAVGAFAASSVGVGMEFDSSMSQVAATMGKSTDEIGDLRDFALEMGSTTSFSASQAAEALNYMALAGYDSEKSMAMLPNVLNLAAAGGMELAAASDMVTDAQSALGLSTDEASELVDKMAKASSKSNTSVSQLGDAILAIGGTAKNLAGGTTELSTSLGILADNGIKGAEGGTHLRNIILALGSPTDTAAKALSKLGVEVYDADGKMKPLNETFGDLNKSLSSMSQGDKMAAIGDIFNTTDIASVNALLDTSAERWQELGVAIDDSAGAAEQMAETQLDNLEGDTIKFKSALEGAQIAIADQLNPTLREFTQFGTDAISTMSTAFQEGGLSGAMEALGTVLSDGLAMVIEMLPGMIDAGMQLLGALGQGILDNLPMVIEAAAQIIVTLATGIGEALPELIPSVVDTLLTVVDTLIENMPLILDAGMQLLMGLTEGIINAIPLLVERLPEIIISTVNFLSENLPTILEQGTQMLLSLGMGIIEAIPQLVAQLPEIITSIVSFITENLPLIIETGINLIVQLGVGLIQAIPQLVANLPIIIAAIVEGFAQVPGMMIDIGKNIVEGVWNGITAMGSWIKDKVSGFFGSIVDSVKGLLGIHSPSTVFAGIGDNMALGLGQGFESTMGNVTKGIENAIPTDFDIPKPNIPEIDIPKPEMPDPDILKIDIPKPEMPDPDILKIDIPKPEVPDPDRPPPYPDASMDDITYSVDPVIGKFNPPDGISINADVNPPGVQGVSYAMQPIAESLDQPKVDDLSYQVSPLTEEVHLPQISDITYGVKPIVEEINTPAISDITYSVDPVIGKFNPPDASTSAVYSDEAADNTTRGNESSETSSLTPFAPVITIEIKGDSDEKVVEDMRTTLRDTVKELFDEFKEQELERMALKNQYAF